MVDKVIPTNMPHPTSMVGWDGTDFRILLVDALHHLQVDILSGALPAGAATAANQLTEITALQLIDDLRAALHSVNTDELQVNVEDSVLPTGAATEATLAEVSARIGDETGPAAGSLNELLRIIETDLANLMLYDRGLSKVVNSYSAGLDAHGTTTRYTYTVPANMRALFEAACLVVGLPDVNHYAQANVLIDGVTVILQQTTPASTIANQRILNWSGGIWMTAGTVLTVTTETDSGATVMFQARTCISQFNG